MLLVADLGKYIHPSMIKSECERQSALMVQEYVDGADLYRKVLLDRIFPFSVVVTFHHLCPVQLFWLSHHNCVQSGKQGLRCQSSNGRDFEMPLPLLSQGFAHMEGQNIRLRGPLECTNVYTAHSLPNCETIAMLLLVDTFIVARDPAKVVSWTSILEVNSRKWTCHW